MSVLDLREWEPQGETYSPELDRVRLNRQQQAVHDVMIDGQWRTLRELSDSARASEASASARLRDLRKIGFTVDRRRRGDPKLGIHEYRVSR